MMLENLACQAIRRGEIFRVQHCVSALEQSRFAPTAVELGAVSAKKNNQQQNGRGGGDVECSSHWRQMKTQARKRFDARQRSATSLSSNASDFFRHLIFYARGVAECNWQLTIDPGRMLKSVPLREQPERSQPARVLVRAHEDSKRIARGAL